MCAEISNQRSVEALEERTSGLLNSRLATETSSQSLLPKVRVIIFSFLRIICNGTLGGTKKKVVSACHTQMFDTRNGRLEIVALQNGNLRRAERWLYFVFNNRAILHDAENKDTEGIPACLPFNRQRQRDNLLCLYVNSCKKFCYVLEELCRQRSIGFIRKAYVEFFFFFFCYTTIKKKYDTKVL